MTTFDNRPCGQCVWETLYEDEHGPELWGVSLVAHPEEEKPVFRVVAEDICSGQRFVIQESCDYRILARDWWETCRELLPKTCVDEDWLMRVSRRLRGAA